LRDLKYHGEPPFKVILVHGGPGAAGELGALAKGIPEKIGILEPYFLERTLEGQINILHEAASVSNIPVILVGWSFGAWLSICYASRNPSLVSKLVLIGSGPLEEKYASEVMRTRLQRSDPEDREKIEGLFLLASGDVFDNNILRKIDEVLSKVDNFDIIPERSIEPVFDISVFRYVSGEVTSLRRSGKLLEMARNIRVPIVVIHGSYDPHPFDGIKGPLEGALSEIEFHLLSQCGHRPWLEKGARKRFYDILIPHLI
jgi:pimeloyl-ACP methyl ester carboxylesterase